MGKMSFVDVDMEYERSDGRTDSFWMVTGLDFYPSRKFKEEFEDVLRRVYIYNIGRICRSFAFESPRIDKSEYSTMKKILFPNDEEERNELKPKNVRMFCKRDFIIENYYFRHFLSMEIENRGITIRVDKVAFSNKTFFGFDNCLPAGFFDPLKSDFERYAYIKTHMIEPIERSISNMITKAKVERLINEVTSDSQTMIVTLPMSEYTPEEIAVITVVGLESRARRYMPRGFQLKFEDCVKDEWNLWLTLNS